MRHMLGESMYSPVFRWINCPVKFSLIVWPTKNYPVSETEHYFCSVSNIIFVQSQTSKGDQKWRLTGQKKSESGQKNHSLRPDNSLLAQQEKWKLIWQLVGQRDCLKVHGRPYSRTLVLIYLSELFLCTSWFNRYQKTFGPIVEIWNSRQHPSHCLFWNQSRLC